MLKKFSIGVFALVVLGLLWSWKPVSIVKKATPLPSVTEMASVAIVSHANELALGDVSAVDIDSEGNVYVLHRAGYGFSNEQMIDQDVVSVFSPKLELIRSWGSNQFKSPHGLTIDSRDNVWITDVMQNKVYRFDNSGKLLKSYGDDYPFYREACLRVRNKFKRLPCGQTTSSFARPTDVEVYPDGSFVVADGYRNSRIARFAANGELLWESGAIGNDVKQFYLPHGLAMDNSGNLYVADRRNARVQVFDSSGEWLNNFEQAELGRPYGLDVATDGYLYVVDAGDAYEFAGGMPRSQIVKLSLEGEIITRYSGFGSQAGQMDLPHDIAVSPNGQIFVAEINNRRLQVFEPQ